MKGIMCKTFSLLNAYLHHGERLGLPLLLVEVHLGPKTLGLQGVFASTDLLPDRRIARLRGLHHKYTGNPP
jgi:hypothetical protein